MAKRVSAVKKFEIYFNGLKTDEAKQIEAAHVYDIISPFLRKRKAATAKGKAVPRFPNTGLPSPPRASVIPADSQIKGA